MRVLIFLLIFITSCKANKAYNENLNFDELFNLSMKQYKQMLINYNKKNDYPNIDK